ncbi:MAG: hypothetical protein ACI8RZ_002203 [Myxococcota bacterium]|jgi:hypothetical protein
MSNTHTCPICGTGSLPSNPRYRRYVCRVCTGRAADRTGRILHFYNTSIGGGFTSVYADNGDTCGEHICYIDGRECWAAEARFGGIVIQLR